jgi:hypothetical protein
MSMALRKETRKVAQAWIELLSEDPEAASALDVAKSELAAGQHLRGLRRIRLFEIEGRLPTRERLEVLLHGSTQFYNPHKERCVVRLAARDAAPLRPEERAILVVERDGARRGAAERWWLHETGEAVTVREGVAWALSFDAEGGSQDAEDLALVRGRRQGLLCNPHSQECRWADERVPLPWLEADEDPMAASRPSRRKPASRRSTR